MIWACLFITDIKSVQIAEICIQIYDENCILHKEYVDVYRKNISKMSETEYRSLKKHIAYKMNNYLDNVDRIVVWDMTTYTLLSEALKGKNNRTRYFIIMNENKYFPYKKESIKSSLSKMNLQVDFPDDAYASLSKIMCDIISKIAIKTYQTNPYFITGLSECRSIIKTERKNDSLSPVIKTENHYKEIQSSNNIPKTSENAAKAETIPIDFSDKEIRAEIIKSSCDKYGLKCRIDFDTVFIDTWISSWYFSLNGSTIKLKHENRRNIESKQKFYERYHNQEKSFDFKDADKAIYYIYCHDEGLKKRYK